MGIKNLFKKKQPEQYLVKTPLEVQKQLEKDPRYKALKQAYTSSQIQNQKLTQKLQLIKEEKQEEKELRDIEVQVLRQKEIDKKLEKSTSMIWRMKAVRRLPKFFTRSNNSIGKFYGFLAKSTRDGVTLFYPLILSAGKIKKMPVYSTNWLDFFHSRLNIPQQLKSGKFDSDVDFTSDGKPVIIKDKTLIERLSEQEYGGKVKVLQMDEIERAEWEKKYTSEREKNKQLLGILAEMKDREVDYEDEINEANMNNSYLQKDRDIQTAHATNLQQKQLDFVTATAKALSSNQDLKLESVMAESLSNSLLETTDNLRDKLSRYISQDKLETAMQEVQEIFMRGADFTRQAQVPTKLVVTPEKEPPQPEPKK